MLRAFSWLTFRNKSIQREETSVFGVPCLTLQKTMERPITVTHGTNRVIGTEPGRIRDEGLRTVTDPPHPNGTPPLWDGQATKRTVKALILSFKGRNLHR